MYNYFTDKLSIYCLKEITNPNPSPIGTGFGFACFGGPEGARTLDLTDANRALSRMVRFSPGAGDGCVPIMQSEMKTIRYTLCCVND